MKTNRLFNHTTLVATGCILLAACTERELGPVLPESNTFVAPAISNGTTATSAILLPANASAVYEEFKWAKADYGISLSTNYTLEVDDNEDFANPQKLAEGSITSISVSVEDMNDALLALGLPGFQEATVKLRVRATINGYSAAPLFSQVITRVATTYQTSECGKYCTVGIIGDATPGGWDVDTDMRLLDATRVDKNTWTTTIYLVGGKKAKFRASDAWEVNWGAAGFPSGTGTQNGADITIPTTSYYKVVFNDNTGAYTFTPQATPVFAAMGVIGTATPGGWDSDTDLTKDPNDPHVWTGTITLTTGDAKFRADNDWANNWGSNTAPSGFGIGNGPNIPVTGATYFIRFNDATGEYSLNAQNRSTPYVKLGVIGPAQSGGWDADTDMTRDPTNPFLWSRIITLADGDAKFRADDAWAANWGASAFPKGTGAADGANIPVKAGTYFITFNTGTGEYYFLK